MFSAADVEVIIACYSAIDEGFNRYFKQTTRTIDLIKRGFEVKEEERFTTETYYQPQKPALEILAFILHHYAQIKRWHDSIDPTDPTECTIQKADNNEGSESESESESESKTIRVSALLDDLLWCLTSWETAYSNYLNTLNESEQNQLFLEYIHAHNIKSCADASAQQLMSFLDAMESLALKFKFIEKVLTENYTLDGYTQNLIQSTYQSINKEKQHVTLDKKIKVAIATLLWFDTPTEQNRDLMENAIYIPPTIAHGPDRTVLQFMSLLAVPRRRALWTPTFFHSANPETNNTMGEKYVPQQERSSDASPPSPS